MEKISTIKEDFKKTVLLYLFPGIVVCWPFVVAFFIFEKDNGTFEEFKIEHIEVFIYLLIIIVFYGVGHFVGKLGHRLELWLERIAFCSKPEEFKQRWESYLKTYFSKEKEPVIIRYYSNFIVSYKYELIMVWSILLMLLSILLLNQFDLLTFSKDSCIVISLISVLSFIYLIYEAYQGAKSADELRQIILETFEEIPK